MYMTLNTLLRVSAKNTAKTLTFIKLGLYYDSVAMAV